MDRGSRSLADRAISGEFHMPLIIDQNVVVRLESDFEFVALPAMQRAQIMADARRRSDSGPDMQLEKAEVYMTKVDCSVYQWLNGQGTFDKFWFPYDPKYTTPDPLPAIRPGESPTPGPPLPGPHLRRRVRAIIPRARRAHLDYWLSNSRWRS